MKHIRLITSCFFIVLSALSAVHSQSTYYVSNEGSDEADGLSPETAWHSIAKVNEQTLQPGDSVLFNKGDIFREELRISQSGSQQNPIVYSAFGTGKRPRIYASAQCSNFETTSANNVWRSTSQVNNPGTAYAGSLYFEEGDTTIWGRSQKEYDESFTELQQEYDWCWFNNNIYVYSVGDPDTKYTSIEVGQRDHAIVLTNPNPNYIVIDGLQTSYGKRRIIYCEYPAIEARGLTIRNCEISFAGIKGGMSAYGIFTFYSDLLIENNLIHDCGRRGISYSVYERRGVVLENIVIQNNTFYNGYHTTAIDCQILVGNGNERGDTLRNFFFRNNLVYNRADEVLQEPEGETSNDIFFQAEDTTGGNTAYLTGIYIYNNIIVNSKSRSILVRYCDTVYCWNNTIYGSNQNARPIDAYGDVSEIWSLVAFFCTSNIDFRNNIVYGNAVYSVSGPAACLFAEENELNTYRPHFIAFDNNLFFQEDSINQRILYYRDPIAGGIVKMDRYLEFGDEGWDEYVTDHPVGHNANSPRPADPLFLSAEQYDFRLMAESPARGNGVEIALITNDYLGNPVNNPPDIGAIQYYDGAAPPPTLPEDDNNFSIYPNPVVNNLFRISLPDDDFESFYFEVYNVNGAFIYRSDTNTSRVTTFNTNGLFKGMYVIKIYIDARDPITGGVVFL